MKESVMVFSHDSAWIRKKNEEKFAPILPK